MNKLQKLAQLNKDIELLENAGKFKAAEVMQRKFLKEAQADAFIGLVTQDAKNFMMQLDQAYNSGQSTLAVIQKAERAGLPPQELQVLKNHAAKIRTQANNDFNSQYPNTGYQTPVDAPQTQQQPVAKDNFQNYFTEQSDTNFYQQQNAMPNLKQTEDPIYQQAINQIANLLNTRVPDNRTIAQNIYEQTIGKFQDPKRKKAFGDQFQKLVSKNFPQNRPV
jgi:hypothetical protein